MRFIETIPHPHCGIHIFHWNGKYILKIEWGDLEQIYKISENTPKALFLLKEMINVDFLNQCLQRFLSMRQNIQEIQEKNPNL